MKLNKQTLLLLGIISIGLTAYSLIPNFEREEFNTEVIEDISSGIITTTTSKPQVEENHSKPLDVDKDTEVFEPSKYDSLLINNNTKRIDELFTSYLIIGSDQRSVDSSESRGSIDGSRADVILIVTIDTKSKVSLISLPRDLLIQDPCTKNIQRINSSFISNGCGSDSENLSAVILNVTGLKIDHFVKFSFEGFEKIIDSIGGVEICVSETQREGYSFEIEKGCNNLNGEIALNWIVSRNTEILDGEKLIDENGQDISTWKPMPGVSDLTRIKKQQQLILSMMQAVNEFNSFNDFLNFVNALENAFTIDQNISIFEATSLLWDFREIDFDKVTKLTVPTYNYTTENGAQVLILAENFYNFIQSEGLID